MAAPPAPIPVSIDPNSVHSASRPAPVCLHPPFPVVKAALCQEDLVINLSLCCHGYVFIYLQCHLPGEAGFEKQLYPAFQLVISAGLGSQHKGSCWFQGREGLRGLMGLSPLLEGTETPLRIGSQQNPSALLGNIMTSLEDLK